MRYCRKCGYQLEDDALFCSQCGEKITKEQPGEGEKEKKKDKTGCGCLTVLFIAIVAFLAFAFTFNTADNGGGDSGLLNKMISRDATNNDIIVTQEMNLSALGVDLVITPNTDIKNLRLEMTFYDNEGNVLDVQTVVVGNVKEGVQVRKAISVADISLLDIVRIGMVSINVVGGTVYYL